MDSKCWKQQQEHRHTHTHIHTRTRTRTRRHARTHLDGIVGVVDLGDVVSLRVGDEQLIQPAALTTGELAVFRTPSEGGELDCAVDIERREERIEDEAQSDAVGGRVGHACAMRDIGCEEEVHPAQRHTALRHLHHSAECVERPLGRGAALHIQVALALRNRRCLEGGEVGDVHSISFPDLRMRDADRGVGARRRGYEVVVLDGAAHREEVHHGGAGRAACKLHVRVVDMLADEIDPPARERHLSRRAAVDFLEQLSQNSLASCIIACCGKRLKIVLAYIETLHLCMQNLVLQYPCDETSRRVGDRLAQLERVAQIESARS